MIGALLGLKQSVLAANPFAKLAAGLGGMRNDAMGALGGAMGNTQTGNPLRDLLTLGGPAPTQGPSVTNPLMAAMQPQAPIAEALPAITRQQQAAQGSEKAAARAQPAKAMGKTAAPVHPAGEINGLPMSIGPVGTSPDGKPAGRPRAARGPQTTPAVAPAPMTLNPALHNEPVSLIQNESGGNWSAQNNAKGAGGKKGHFGRLQFGHARLSEAKAAGVMPRNMTPAQFMKSPEVQRAVEDWHWSDIDQYAERKGITQQFGQTIGDVTLTRDSFRAMAHLGGSGGAERFVRTGGKYNPADINGTRLSDYGKRHVNAWGGKASADGPTIDNANRMDRTGRNPLTGKTSTGPAVAGRPKAWDSIIAGEPGTFGEDGQDRKQRGGGAQVEQAEAPPSQMSDTSRRQQMLQQAIQMAGGNPQGPLRRLPPQTRFATIAQYGAMIRGEDPRDA